MFSREREPQPSRVLSSGWGLWGAVTTLCYLSGSRRARRTAVRALIAACTSALFDSLAGLVRPGRVHRASMDAALAGSFASAAALELRSKGLPIGALAVSSIAARTMAGLDSPASALGGSLLGSVATGLSTRIWPVTPPGGVEAPSVQLPSHAEPSDGGEGLTVAVNRDSGTGAPPTDALKDALPDADVVEVEIERGDELRKALDARTDSSVALGVAGGDGTINTAAQVALDENKVLMVIPSGTFNHLTGALGIDGIDDSVSAVKEGQAVSIDVASIDGKTFLNTASFGGYVEFVDAREKLEHKIGKWPAVVVALIRVLRTYEPIEIEIDGKRACVWMAFIGNCRYHPSGFAPSWRERLDDELLDFRYVDGSAPMSRVRLILAVLTGRLGRSKVYHQSLERRVRIRSLSGPLRLARDGETFDGSDDIIIEKLPERLSVFVPQVSAS